MTDQEFARQCYALTLKGLDPYQIANALGVTQADVVFPGRKDDDTTSENTDRDLEIARVNEWNVRLEEIWDSLSACSADDRETFIHRFVASFDRLSKARRALGGLDKPVRTHQTITSTQGPITSIDAEIERLSVELGFRTE